MKYGNNLLHENDAFGLELTADRLEGLPNAVREAAREKAQAAGLGDKSYLFTLHKPSMLPFLSYAKDRKLREELYTAYLDRCNHGDEYDNKALVNDYIRLRTEKAHLLGYDSYADYVTADQMAATPAAVYALLDEIWTPALDRAKEELAAMEEMLRADHPDATFEPWDWWYYAEKVRRRDYALDDEALRPYFTLENVQGRHLLSGQQALRYHLPADRRTALQSRLPGLRSARRGREPFGRTLLRLLRARGQERRSVVRELYRTVLRERRARGARRRGGDQLCPSDPVRRRRCSISTRRRPSSMNSAMRCTACSARWSTGGLADVEGDFVELPSQVMEKLGHRTRDAGTICAALPHQRQDSGIARAEDRRARSSTRDSR